MLKRFVYVLRNDETPPRYYTGVTSNVSARLDAHNHGRCFHTTKHRPWSIDVIVEFADEQRALAFERYLDQAWRLPNGTCDGFGYRMLSSVRTVKRRKRE